jgi:hypothetical protein
LFSQPFRHVHIRAILLTDDYFYLSFSLCFIRARARLQTLTSDTVSLPSFGITSSGPYFLWRSSRQVSGVSESPPTPSFLLFPSLSCARAWRFYARFHNNILYCSVLSFDVVCCIEITICRPPVRLDRIGTCVQTSPYPILAIIGVRKRCAIIMNYRSRSVQLAI